MLFLSLNRFFRIRLFTFSSNDLFFRYLPYHFFPFRPAKVSRGDEILLLRYPRLHDHRPYQSQNFINSTNRSIKHQSFTNYYENSFALGKMASPTYAVSATWQFQSTAGRGGTIQREHHRIPTPITNGKRLCYQKLISRPVIEQPLSLSDFSPISGAL